MKSKGKLTGTNKNADNICLKAFNISERHFLFKVQSNQSSLWLQPSYAMHHLAYMASES